MSDEIAAYLGSYQPQRRYPPGVLTWAIAAVLQSRPTSERDARTLCTRCCDLAEWLLRIGYGLDEPIADLLSEQVITAYLDQSGFAEGTRQTMASAFRRVRRALTGERRVMQAGRRTDVDSAVVPASDQEVRRFLEWVNRIDDQHVAHGDGLILVTLIRGAGCTKADLDVIAGVEVRPGSHLVVAIGGAAARSVMVDPRWAKPLLAVLPEGASGSPFEIDGRGRAGSQCLKNLESRYYNQRRRLDAKGVRSVPGFLNLNSYRAAWLIDRLQAGVRLDHLLKEAGLVSAAALDRYLQYLPDSRAPRFAR